MVFRSLIMLFSYGYNIETCKIIEATFLTLHFLPYARFFAGQEGGMTQWSRGRGHGPVVHASEHSLLLRRTCLFSLAMVVAITGKAKYLFIYYYFFFFFFIFTSFTITTYRFAAFCQHELKYVMMMMMMICKPWNFAKVQNRPNLSQAVRYQFVSNIGGRCDVPWRRWFAEIIYDAGADSNVQPLISMTD